MVKVGAAGLTGHAAVEKIIRDFERPADPDSSVRNAIARYGDNVKPGGGGRTAPRRQPRRNRGGEFTTNKPEVMAARATAKAEFTNALIEQSQARARGEPMDAGALVGALRGHREAQALKIIKTPKKKVQGVRRAPAPSPGNAGGRVTTRGKLIGHPHSGTHTLGNWQSDNAIDISMPEGTPIYAAFNGVVGSRFGPIDSSDPRFAGLRMTLEGKKNQLFYAHLSRFAPGVRPGARIKKGQIIGYSGSANGVPHLHLGSMNRDPGIYFGGS